MKKLFLILLLAPAFSHALEITFTPSNDCKNHPAYTGCEQALADAEAEANSQLPPVSEDQYAEGISNSNVMAYKGLGSDYSDNFDLFVIRAAGGLGAQSDGLDLQDTEKLEGIAAGATVTVGLNLDLLPIDKIGPVDFRKLDIFFNFMSYSMKKEIDTFMFDGDISATGLYARYRLIDSVDILSGQMLKWGGLHLHTGIQQSTMNVNLSQNFKGQQQSGSFTVDYDADAVFDIKSSVTSIPVELSSYFRAAYVFTVYGGAGFDMNAGNTEVTLQGDGELTQSGTTNQIGTVSANGEGSGSPVATNFRAFAGFQFNIPVARVYVQANKMLGQDVLSANAGVKFAW